MKEKKNRKEWIKTLAIIFLAVLLVLTFFSNTIMNFSLPEVSAEYCYEGQITNKVRGNGIVTAEDPYSVTATYSRKIASVAVRVGDEVEKGNVLFTLEEGESEELKQAQKELDSLVSEYERNIITSAVATKETTAIENGTTDDFKTSQTKLEAAKKKVDSLKASVDSYAKQLTALSSTTSQIILNKNEKDAQKAISAATEALNAWTEQHKKNESSLNVAYADYNAALNAESSYRTALSNVDRLETELQELQASVDVSGNSQLLEKLMDTTIDELMAARDELDAAEAYLELAPTILPGLQAVYESAAANYNTSEAKVAECTNILANANANLTNISNNADETSYNTDLSVAEITAKQALAQANLAKAEEDYSKLMSELSTRYGLEDQYKAIKEKTLEVDKLKAEVEGETITAPVSGTILSLDIVAGETTTKDMQVASIQKSGNGFTLEMELTQDQVKLVSIGDEAEVTNSWWYNDVHARLTAIRPNPSNPKGGKLAIFELEGDLTAGQSLSLTVGKKTANYDTIVPNSAIRDDSNGKFVLRINSKSTPLGTRYIAERVDVTILATDDTMSAVSGDFEGWDYVITNSTKPVEAGKQVRLKD